MCCHSELSKTNFGSAAIGPPYSNAKEVLDTRGHLRIRQRVRASGCVGFPMLSVYQAASFENYFSG